VQNSKQLHSWSVTAWWCTLWSKQVHCTSKAVMLLFFASYWHSLCADIPISLQDIFHHTHLGG